MVEEGAGLVAASHSVALADRVAETFRAAGLVCESSTDPVGVELAGVAKNAADPAGHYSRPDVTRLLLNTSRANRVEHFTLPVDAEVMSEIKLQA